MKAIQSEIIRVLKDENPTYAHPIKSCDLAKRLRVDPSYLRLQMAFLKGIVGVRRGKRGGYYLLTKDNISNH
ncbi:MAG: Rrf2 family transcriptional regulator [Candidatus Omnitrophica bacterium]|nr:Rrf2 family transcriptional regulator [Candidatus Omnitrophota bacterium]MCM8827512.1 Rrf2 family transcriptional regulator [Candidatus Omnitrophota bacterium]